MNWRNPVVPRPCQAEGLTMIAGPPGFPAPLTELTGLVVIWGKPDFSIPLPDCTEGNG